MYTKVNIQCAHEIYNVINQCHIYNFFLKKECPYWFRAGFHWHMQSFPLEAYLPKSGRLSSLFPSAFMNSHEDISLKEWQNWMQVSRQNVHTNVLRNSAHNDLKVDTAWISITGWMDKPNVVHSYNEMLFSHKMEEIHVTTQMNLKVVLREISQAQRKTYGMIPLIWNVQMGKSLETESRSVVAKGWGEGLRMAAWWVQGCLLGWWEHSGTG